MLVVLVLLLTSASLNNIINNLLEPVKELHYASKALALGDLKQRVKVKRRDEIGRISGSFNMVADKMELLINNLETNVRERRAELHQANLELEEKSDQLHLQLNSTAETIFGIDLDGYCTFCKSAASAASACWAAQTPMN